MKQSTFHVKRTSISLALASVFALPGIANATPNYGEALQKSIYFYEAQQAGELPSWNRVEWRGDATVNDGSDVGLDLSGGWYDAGDHVKFGFPMAASATMLAWGVVENPQAYEASGQMQHIRNNLRFVADYFVAAHPDDNTFYGQVGTGSSDHAWWGPVEVLEATGKATATRPSYAISPTCPGTDLAGETAAALAAIAMVFAEDDPAYSSKLLTHAESLYHLAVTYKGKYSDCITDASGFYNSWSGYQDELVWSAAWLYRATGNSSYLSAATSAYNNLGTTSGGVKSYTWTQAWDDKSYGSYVLMAKLTGNSSYRADAERWLDYWTTGYNGQRVSYTSGGLAQLDQWGANRYAANTAWIALVYSDYLKSVDPTNSRVDTYYNFAVSQLQYLLGDNPMGIPYQIGLTEDGPKNPHHRTSHGSWSDSINSPTDNRHLLIGALVGGPGSGDSYTDDRSDYVANEVATDYNAGFTSALARLYLDFGGSPIAEDQFPPAETRDDEFYVEAAVNSSGPRYVELKTVVYNHSAWPARVSDHLTMRYWVDLSAEIAAGYDVSDVTISSGYSQATSISALQSWGNPDDHIYYIDISFAGVNIFPGGQSDSQKEVQFRLSLPTNTNSSDWDNSADPSWDNYSSSLTQTSRIALYDNGELVWGEEPSAACGADTGVNCAPEAESLTVTGSYNTTLGMTLTGTDSDGSVTDFVIVDQPQHGTIEFIVPATGTASAWYTPASGFFGTDSFTYQVVDDQGASSAVATVNITIEAPVVPAVTIQSPTAGTEIEAGSNFTLQLAYSNAASVEIQINGTTVATEVTSNQINLQAPASTGNFTLTLIALDDEGNELDASSTVTLVAVEPQPNQAPDAAFIISSQFLVVGFDASGSSDANGDSLTYQWDFGDNSSATGVTTSHTYSSAGTYTVTLTVSDGEDSTSISREISVEAAVSGAVSCENGSGDIWNTGAVLNNIKVTNLGDTSTDWSVEIPVNGATAIQQAWGATVVLSGNRLIATGTGLAAGGSQLFGIQLEHSGNFSYSACISNTDDSGSDDSGTGGSDDNGGSNDGSGTGNTPQATCSFDVTSEWNSGFTGQVTITNTSSTTINGWNTYWVFNDGSTFANGWSANYSSNGNSVSASAMSWNSSIAPGASVIFGFNGNKATNSSAAPSVEILGDICN
ncbi:glycoside hydrolase family 9 protein [Parathalassolituus penaei]|uniref:Endoglucanase n=1 Tax=Parathalassolituus penaei TaxID=2997323 RepID=A0A9X3EFP2_9GAMM|nr:glycoside hydrolase family 9 protein [Parathalassolituus penaei]MCY0966707.1 glycoside hydrolase family 9 protein [Parathalassolituus penaei]